MKDYEPHNFEVRIRKNGKPGPVIGRGSIMASPPFDIATLGTPKIVIEIEGECLLEFQIKEDEIRWQTIKKISVVKF